MAKLTIITENHEVFSIPFRKIRELHMKQISSLDNEMICRGLKLVVKTNDELLKKFANRNIVAFKLHGAIIRVPYIPETEELGAPNVRENVCIAGKNLVIQI